MKRNTWIFLGIGAAVVAGGSYYLLARPKDEIKWRMAKVDRGNVTQKINATGAVSPVVQVAVGTQVSGVISALYADYNILQSRSGEHDDGDLALPDEMTGLHESG
jgi:HlyD family secretion protein